VAAASGFIETMLYDDTPLSLIGGSLDSSVGVGELKYSVDFEGRVTAYLYDNTDYGGGRLVEKRSFASLAAYDNGNGTPAEIVNYQYDKFGRQTTVTIDRDPANPGTDCHVTNNTYDDQGRLIRRYTPTEGAINYEYDPLNGHLIRTYTGDVDPNYTSTAGDDSAVTDTRYLYDQLGRLSKVRPGPLGRICRLDRFGRPDSHNRRRSNPICLRFGG
jgi:hypothetical protein